MARRRRTRRLWIVSALVAAAALGGIAWWRVQSARAPADFRAAPHEEIREGDRRALRELLERKSARERENLPR